jgi:tRNA (cytidine32/uridine32-2'-O)-methyltransferase
MDLARRFQFVLVGTRSPGNLGAAARALKNMGFRRLAVAEPVIFDDAGYLSAEARRMAVGATELLDGLQVEDALDALLPAHAHVVATTARRRSGLPLSTPREAAAGLVARAARGPVVVLFGPEDTGLQRRHLARCGQGLVIPASRAHATLNVSQALLLVAYELRMALLARPGLPASGSRRLPGQQALQGFCEDLETTLEFIDFLKPHNRERVLSDLKETLARAEPDRRELAMWRGVLRQMRWFKRRASST